MVMHGSQLRGHALCKIRHSRLAPQAMRQLPVADRITIHRLADDLCMWPMAADVLSQKQRATAGDENGVQGCAAVPQVRGIAEDLPRQVSGEVVHDSGEILDRLAVVAQGARLNRRRQLVIAQVVEAGIALRKPLPYCADEIPAADVGVKRSAAHGLPSDLGQAADREQIAGLATDVHESDGSLCQIGPLDLAAFIENFCQERAKGLRDDVTLGTGYLA